VSTNAIPINAQITTAAYDAALGLPAGTRPAGVTSDVFYADPGVFPGASGGNSVPADGNIVPGSTNKGTTPASQYIYSNGRQSVWNFNQTSGAYPAFQHYGAFLNGERDLFGSKNVRVYWDSSYNHNFSESQLAPLATGTFTTPGAVEYVIPARTATPLPLPDGRARAAVAGAFNPFNPFNIDITGGTKFRLFEFGNRILKTDSDAFMATVGVKMDDLLNGWNVDAGMRYSSIAVHQDFKLVSTSRFNQIVNQNDPIFNPASSNYIGTTVAYNPFGYAPDNPIASNALTVAYASIHVKDQDTTALSNPFLTINNSAIASLPAGDMGAALGVDYRVESLNANPDAFSLLGDDGSGQESYVDRARKVIAYFGELSIPVFSPKQNVAGAYSLSVDLAGREENFLSAHKSKFLPSVAVRYQPLDDTLVIRASYGKGIRQPSLFELYNGVVNGLQSLVDPRDSSSLPENPIQSASNSKLAPETSTTYTAGIVWSPKNWNLKGFTVNADYWHVERTGTVYAAAQDVLDRFFGKHPGGAAAPGGLLPGEFVLLDGSGNILSVTAPYHNLGKTIAKGFDLGTSYLLETNSMGRFDFALGGTYLWSFRQAILANVPLVELVNTDASQGQGLDGYVRWKAKGSADWTKGDMSARLVANYTSGFEDLDADGNPFQVYSYTTFDAQFTYTIHQQLGKYLENTKLTIGAFNLLDKNPPYSSGFGSNASGYPGFMYDSTGRFVYASLSRKF
jgi:iron complex outermembrane receptor protein